MAQVKRKRGKENKASGFPHLTAWAEEQKTFKAENVYDLQLMRGPNGARKEPKIWREETPMPGL